MKEALLKHAAEWLDAGEPVAMATIVRIFGTSNQPLASRMIMTRGNRFVGAVSGGCVETDVYEAGQVVMDDGHPLMLHYKKVENPVVEIGLNCDGRIDVLVERLDYDLYSLLTEPGYRANVTLCYPNRPLAPEPLHAQVAPENPVPGALPSAVVQDALAALDDDRPVTVSYPDGRVALFEPVLPPPTLLIFGAEQVAVPLVQFARLLGFRTVVADARPAFATRERHPDADLVLHAWPEEVIAQVGVDRRTYVVSLNHEPRFEDALLHALAGRAMRYLGAIGHPSRRAERHARAEAAGFDLSQLPPVHTPIGLDIGGKSPEEIALSIIAEIVAVRNGHSGGMLHTQR
jgi:xanthine dehydrogenase accessory factor